MHYPGVIWIYLQATALDQQALCFIMFPGPPTTRTQRNVRNQKSVAKESAQRTSAVVANRLGRNRFDGELCVQSPFHQLWVLILEALAA